MPHIHPPTRGQSRWRAAGYLAVSVIGFYTLFGQDLSASGYVQGALTVVWALFMLTAVPTALSVLHGKYRLEAILLPLFGSALLIAVANAAIRAVTSSTGRGDLIFRASLGAAVLCFLVLRGLQLHQITEAGSWTSTSLRS